MKVSLEILRAAVNQLLDHAAEQHGSEIDLDADYYWFIPKEALETPETDPSGLTLGSLEFDWEHMTKIAAGEEPIGYAMVWAAALLRAVGDRTM